MSHRWPKGSRTAPCSMRLMGFGPTVRMVVFDDRVHLGGSGSYGALLHSGWVIDEEFDADGGEAGGGWTAGAEGRRFGGEGRTARRHRQSSDNVVIAEVH